MINSNYDRQVTVRTGRVTDAKGILEIQRKVMLENDYLVTEVEEFDRTLDQQKEGLQNILHNERETIIVAVANNDVVG